jgi:hypothetical protein
LLKARRDLVARIAKRVKKLGDREIPANATVKRIRQCVKHESNDTFEHISLSTIYRDLKARGFFNLVRPKRAFDGAEHLRRRLTFAKEMPKMFPTAGPLEHALVFSDEHYVTANDNSHPRMWVDARKHLLPRIVKARNNTINVMMWAAIGYNYKSPIIFIDTTIDRDEGKAQRLTAEGYKLKCLVQSKVIEHCLANKRVFMQDGARIHTANTVLNYLEKSKKVMFIKQWPPHSPDLNPIEQMWAVLNAIVAENFAPAKSIAELQQQVRQAWEEIPMDVINRAVASFAARLKKVRACGGN